MSIETIARISMLLPVIVAVVILGAVVKFAHGLILAALGRGTPVAPGPATPVGRFVGGALSALLAPIEQVIRIVALFVLSAAVFFGAARLGVIEDGLIDTEATVIGASRRCFPRAEEPTKGLVGAPVCPASVPDTMRALEVIDVAYATRAGEPVIGHLPVYLLDGRDATIGRRLAVSYRSAVPERLDAHIGDQILISPWWLALAAAVIWQVARVVRRLRRSMAGRVDSDDDGLFSELKRWLRKSRDGVASAASDLGATGGAITSDRLALALSPPRTAAAGGSDRRPPPPAADGGGELRPSVAATIAVRPAPPPSQLP